MAGTWKVFNKAKHYLLDATHDLSGGTYRITLHTSASTLKTSASALVLTAYSQVTNEVTSGYGYSSSGKTLASLALTATAATTQKWGFTSPYWSANGGTISSIKYACISKSTNQLLCYCTLTTGAGGISLTTGSRLTISIPSTGCLKLA